MMKNEEEGIMDGRQEKGIGGRSYGGWGEGGGGVGGWGGGVDRRKGQFMLAPARNGKCQLYGGFKK